jgi:hypothetical protein
VVTAFKDILQEYPKAFSIDASADSLVASIWPDSVDPMSFARYSLKPENEEGIETLENGATGLAKTTELSISLHASGRSAAAVQGARSLLDPPLISAAPRWYASSGAFGRLAPRSQAHPELERALDAKFDWWLYNQNFVPWYGMWDYGDGKLNFDPSTGTWDIWGDNEPAEDLQLWLQFVRTGETRFARAAQALSRHSMDVDNIHWPAQHFIGLLEDAQSERELALCRPGSKAWRATLAEDALRTRLGGGLAGRLLLDRRPPRPRYGHPDRGHAPAHHLRRTRSDRSQALSLDLEPERGVERH